MKSYTIIKARLKYNHFFGVSCGKHEAISCARCPIDNIGANRGKHWGNGDCFWLLLEATSTSREMDSNK